MESPMKAVSYQYLFGGDKLWGPGELWIALDDRVRGGKSQSHLTGPPAGEPNSVVFYGNLDITALGGAGFASHRSADQLAWNLAGYQGLSLKVREGDAKRYTITLKNCILPKRPDGRERSTVSWEYDYEGSGSEVIIPWHEFKPTYRGRPEPGAEPLDLENVKRIGLMCRSFFGEQEGAFRIELDHIAAVTSGGPARLPLPQPRGENPTSHPSPRDEESDPRSQTSS